MIEIHPTVINESLRNLQKHSKIFSFIVDDQQLITALIGKSYIQKRSGCWELTEKGKYKLTTI